MTLPGTQSFDIQFGDQTVNIKTNYLAKQADGAVLVSAGKTQVLVTVCSAPDVKEGQDFFPLLVDYKEKYYAAGRFLGGFRKREGRPSDQEILLMRMIDRPFRPLFPEGYMAETIITITVLSYDSHADPEVLAGLGASAALAISDVPFGGTVGFCKVGRVNGELMLNPSNCGWKDSDLELVVAATDQSILMIEGEAQELSEQEMLDAIDFAHGHIKDFCSALKDIQKKVGKAKRSFTPTLPSEKVLKGVDKFEAQARECLSLKEKMPRRDAIAALEKAVAEDMKNNMSEYGLEEGASFSKEAHFALDELLYKMMRNDITSEDKRIDGRSLTDVRPIHTEVDLLKSVHGSSLFTRGETQVLAAVTVGGKDGEQLVEDLNGVDFDKFYLHYTFAPFCVGEARGYRGVGRREIGHGNLAKRAVEAVIPAVEKFPYTIRVNCEVLESNGSSSMGSVCSASMALMDAGVPLKAPVAGVAMGLIKSDAGDFKILTDILGDEDHLGDMDFKVAGTENGITAIQMDIKIDGITREIFEKAFAQARDGRLHILGEMKNTIEVARSDFKVGVPKIEMLKTEPDKIGGFIGPGGKNIKAFQELYDVNIDCLDDGTIKIIGSDPEQLKKALANAELQLNGPKLNDVYEAEVVSTKEYGAFLDIAPNVSGLLHVSEIANERVHEVEDYLQVGEKIKVKVIEIDNFGKFKFSAKAIQPLERQRETPPGEGATGRADRERGGGRGGFGGRGGSRGGPRRGDRGGNR